MNYQACSVDLLHTLLSFTTEKLEGRFNYANCAKLKTFP